MAGLLPRVIWGPTAIISLSYWARALRDQGYESETVVAGVLQINSAEDFDRLRDQFGPRGYWFEPWRDYLVFLYVLRKADVIVTFFDGGFLRWTALAGLEGWLLRLAGIQLVVSPYGSDIAVRGTLGPYEDFMAIDYPELMTRSRETKKRVDWFCRNADLVIRNLQPGYLPRWDLVWPSQLCVDTELFSPVPRPGDKQQGDGVTVVHAPNHRALKGTEFVIDAADSIKRSGRAIKFELLEGRRNDEVRESLASADILVDQLHAGFGMLAVEGMACGLPVVTNLRWLPEEIRSHPSISDAPLIDADAHDIEKRLLALIDDDVWRGEVGRESRLHAERWNSFDAIGKEWAYVLDAVWEGRDVAPSPPSLNT